MTGWLRRAGVDDGHWPPLLLAQHLHLTSEFAQLFALLGGRPVVALAGIAICLGDPVPNRLGRRLAEDGLTPYATRRTREGGCVTS